MARLRHKNYTALTDGLSLTPSEFEAILVHFGFVSVEYVNGSKKYALSDIGQEFGKVYERAYGQQVKWLESVKDHLCGLDSNWDKIVADPIKRPPRVSEEQRKVIKDRYVYVLQLCDNKFYVGSAGNLKRRMREHFRKESKIEWIKKNPIITAAEIYKINGTLLDAYELEDDVALGLAKFMGLESVRGGKLSGNPEKAPNSWSKLLADVKPIDPDSFPILTQSQVDSIIDG